MYSNDSESHSYGQLVIDSFVTTTSPLLGVLVKHQVIQVTQHPYSPDLAPCDFWLFPKLKSLLKGKRFFSLYFLCMFFQYIFSLMVLFQTINKIQENTTGKLMLVGRTVWDPRVPVLKGSILSLSCCTMLLVSCSVNVSIFHSALLDTFWTDLIDIERAVKWSKSTLIT